MVTQKSHRIECFILTKQGGQTCYKSSSYTSVIRSRWWSTVPTVCKDYIYVQQLSKASYLLYGYIQGEYIVLSAKSIMLNEYTLKYKQIKEGITLLYHRRVMQRETHLKVILMERVFCLMHI